MTGGPFRFPAASAGACAKLGDAARPASANREQARRMAVKGLLSEMAWEGLQAGAGPVAIRL
jgi:hypothetical protein